MVWFLTGDMKEGVGFQQSLRYLPAVTDLEMIQMLDNVRYYVSLESTCRFYLDMYHFLFKMPETNPDKSLS